LSSQRDTFLLELLKYAKHDSDIVLLSVDMGAPAIDHWKRDLPNQYLEMGISEQNAINVAAGLSRGGKKVFVYFMAVWIHRCFEQIRYSSAIAGNKITILGNGVGLGYAPAGPAHEPNEDVAVMRTLHGINIYASSTSSLMKEIVSECLVSDKSNYVRFERKSVENYILPTVIRKEFFNVHKTPAGEGKYSPTILVVSYGNVSNRVAKAISNYPGKFTKVNFIDLVKIWPLDSEAIKSELIGIKKLLFIEEQSISGSIFEAFCTQFRIDLMGIEVKSIHLPGEYIFENGDQETLLNKFGFSEARIVSILCDWSN
jgi:transketolase